MTARTYLTAGVAALGVGALALTSVQPLPSQAAPLQQRVVGDMAVSLAAAVDPIQAWVNVFENSAANLGVLAEFYLQKPFPLLQTVGANLQTYAGQLANGQGNLIPGQIWNNIQTFFNAPWDPGATVTWAADPPWDPPQTITQPWIFPTGTGNPTVSGTQPNPPIDPDDNPQSPAGLLALIANPLITASDYSSYEKLPPDLKAVWDIANQIQDLWVLTATPASGQLVALLGPVIAPLVQLTRSFTAIGAAFQAGEALDAVYELINIPANMTNAFLNGLDTPWDLTGVVGNFAPLPDDWRVGLQLGGLLNSMPFNGSLKDPDNPPTEYSGGVAFDSLSIIESPVQFVQAQLPYGLKNGWAGSVVGLGQYLSEQLLVTPPEPEEVAAAAEVAPAPAAALAEEAVPTIVEEDLAEPAPAVEDNSKAESAPAPKAAAATGDASDGNTGRAARSGGRGAR